MLNKPKLFWLHPHFLYWMGGTKYIYEVITRLSSSFDLTVIVENTGDYAAKLYQSAGINLISLNKSSTNFFINLGSTLKREKSKSSENRGLP